MSFIYKSNQSKQQSREHVLQYVRERKKADPSFKVIDIGGGLNPWANEVVEIGRAHV